MTRYEELLGITLEHRFFGEEAFPVKVIPANPKAFDRDGLILRQQGKTVSVIIEAGAEVLPDLVELLVIPAGPEVLQATLGSSWKTVPVLDVPLGTKHVEFWDAAAGRIPQPPQPVLCQLSVAIDPEGPREIGIGFAAVEALWAYHVIGSEADSEIAIFDPEETAAFEQLGAETLPDGRAARVLRSTAPLPIHARPNQRFSLQEPGPFGPKTLIPVLPAAGTSFHPATGAQAAYPFQANIFINLN